MNKLNDQKGLSWRERWFAFRSIFVLHLFSISIRWFGFTTVYRWLERQQNLDPKIGHPKTPIATSLASGDQAMQLGKLVGIGNRRFKALTVPCLPESLTVWWLLRRRGIDARLFLGVRKVENTLDGHAWVEVENRVVSGDPDLAGQFIPVSSI